MSLKYKLSSAVGSYHEALEEPKGMTKADKIRAGL